MTADRVAAAVTGGSRRQHARPPGTDRPDGWRHRNMWPWRQRDYHVTQLGTGRRLSRRRRRRRVATADRKWAGREDATWPANHLNDNKQRAAISRNLRVRTTNKTVEVCGVRTIITVGWNYGCKPNSLIFENSNTGIRILNKHSKTHAGKVFLWLVTLAFDLLTPK